MLNYKNFKLWLFLILNFYSICVSPEAKSVFSFLKEESSPSLRVRSVTDTTFPSFPSSDGHEILTPLMMGK
jgi:hypothetical protein